jgi:hypothetical protein
MTLVVLFVEGKEEEEKTRKKKKNPRACTIRPEHVKKEKMPKKQS